MKGLTQNLINKFSTLNGVIFQKIFLRNISILFSISNNFGNLMECQKNILKI